LKNFRLLRLMHKLSDSLPMFSSETKKNLQLKKE